MSELSECTGGRCTDQFLFFPDEVFGCCACSLRPDREALPSARDSFECPAWKAGIGIPSADGRPAGAELAISSLPDPSSWPSLELIRLVAAVTGFVYEPGKPTGCGSGAAETSSCVHGIPGTKGFAADWRLVLGGSCTVLFGAVGCFFGWANKLRSMFEASLLALSLSCSRLRSWSGGSCCGADASSHNPGAPVLNISRPRLLGSGAGVFNAILGASGMKDAVGTDKPLIGGTLP